MASDKKRWCFVPYCTNTSRKTPEKIFVCVPSSYERKREWFKAAKRNMPTSKTKFFCCQDHFDLKKDAQNYYYYKTFGGPLRMKATIVPYKFDCQQDQKRIEYAKTIKKQRKYFVQEMSVDNIESNINVDPLLNVSSTSTASKDLNEQKEDSTVSGASEINIEFQNPQTGRVKPENKYNLVTPKRITTAKYLYVLRENFGYTTISPLFKKIINILVCKKGDVCAILTPGLESSICYQFPAALNRGTVIVVTPFTLAMCEELQRLSLFKISWCILEQLQDYFNKVNDIIKNVYSIIYINLQLLLEAYQQIVCSLKKANIFLIAIHEAHCVSAFSFDYRFSYRKLEILNNTFTTVPFLTLTTSPRKEVTEDIVSYLHSKIPSFVYSDLHRQNLYLQVKAKENYRLVNDILSVISENQGPTLIYTFSRSDVFELVAKLQNAGFTNCKGYYTGQEKSTMKDIYKSFIENECTTLVTTSACGLTISKKDIRNVIHCHVSRDIESYYQEIGKAGMDGLSAKCTLFYCQNDTDAQDFLRSASLSNVADTIRKKKDLLAEALTSYVITTECRWKFILKHFNLEKPQQPHKTNNLHCCDNCIRNSKESILINTNGRHELSEDFIIVLKEIQNLNASSDCTSIATISKNLTARTSKSILWWKNIVKIMENNNFIRFITDGEVESSGIFQTCITPTGIKFMNSMMDDEIKQKAWYFINKDMKNELINLRLLNPISNK